MRGWEARRKARNRITKPTPDIAPVILRQYPLRDGRKVCVAKQNFQTGRFRQANGRSGISQQFLQAQGHFLHFWQELREAVAHHVEAGDDQRAEDDTDQDHDDPNARLRPPSLTMASAIA